MNKFFCSGTALFLGLSVQFKALSNPAGDQDVQLQVGVVQKFGEDNQDELVIKSNKNEPLTVKAGKFAPLTLNQIDIKIFKKPLKQPILDERVILGSYSTYESAQNNAKKWKLKGIPVEIGQPGRWEVWAKRDVYSTSTTRKTLLKSLQESGYTQVALKSQLLTNQLLLSFQVGAKVYIQSNLDISNKSSLFQVNLKNKHLINIYPGNLHLKPNAYNSYTLVNQVPLESYLRGVVPNEIGPNAPYSALKAQVIIARTYALRNLRRFLIDQYQLCATTDCQVYFGLSQTSPKADKAILATKGEVLTYRNELIDALYSDMTGGISANFQDAWDGQDKPYLKSLIDSPKALWDLNQYPLSNEISFRKFIALTKGFNESKRHLFRWNKTITLLELSKQIREYLLKSQISKLNPNKVLELKIAQRSDSGRIIVLLVESDQGTIRLEKNEIRSAFKSLYSTLFYLEPVFNSSKEIIEYRFIGGGVGHGVGFSQEGSYNLANLGWSNEKILNFYYPNTKITHLNSNTIFWKE